MRARSSIHAAGVSLVLAFVAFGCRSAPSGPATVIVSSPPVAQTEMPVEPRDALPPGMVRVPEGSFQMGSMDGEPDEQPVHRVEIRAFAMDLLEVTLEEYEACVDAGRCSKAQTDEAGCNWGKKERRKNPINCVEWVQARDYCAWKNKRLPTAEVWEYAARGADATRYPWGNDVAPRKPCYERSPEQGTCVAGERPEDISHFGVRDLGGSVVEWTASPYCSYEDSKCASEDHVIKGGAWQNSMESSLRSAWRGHVGPGKSNDVIGFRCAK